MQLSQTIRGILVKALIILSASHSFAGTIGAQVNPWKDNRDLYEATATLLVTGKFYESLSLGAPRSTEPSNKDFIYFVVTAQSNKLLKSLSDQISDDLDKEIRKLLPEPTTLRGRLQTHEILASCVTIEPNLDELQIKFIVRSPDPLISARLANLFVEETITFQLTAVIDRQVAMIEDLRIKVDQVAERIQELEKVGRSDSISTIDLDTEKKLYSELLYGLKAAKIQIGLLQASAVILDQAYPPLKPVH